MTNILVILQSHMVFNKDIKLIFLCKALTIIMHSSMDAFFQINLNACVTDLKLESHQNSPEYKNKSMFKSTNTVKMV